MVETPDCRKARDRGKMPTPELNSRITVEAGKMSEDQILKEFPYLEKEDFQAVYEFFASIPERISVLEASR